MKRRKLNTVAMKFETAPLYFWSDVFALPFEECAFRCRVRKMWSVIWKKWKSKKKNGCLFAGTIAILRELIYSGIVFHTPSFSASIHLTRGGSFTYPMHPIWPRCGTNKTLTEGNNSHHLIQFDRKQIVSSLDSRTCNKFLLLNRQWLNLPTNNNFKTLFEPELQGIQ